MSFSFWVQSYKQILKLLQFIYYEFRKFYELLLCAVKIRVIREIRSPLLNLVESLRQVVDDVIDMLCADAQTDGRGRNLLLSQFLRREL